MEIFIIVLVVIVILIFIFKSDAGKDPSKKTDAMLIKEHNLHIKLQNIALSSHDMDKHMRLVKQSEVLVKEMEKRGLININTQAKDEVDMNTQNEVDQFRKELEEAYDNGLETGRNHGKDQRICNELALTSTLYCQVRKNNNVSNEITQQLMIEHMPFNELKSEDAKRAIVEYEIWKIYPSYSDINIVKDVIQNFVAKGHMDVFENGNSAKYLAWYKLIK